MVPRDILSLRTKALFWLWLGGAYGSKGRCIIRQLSAEPLLAIMAIGETIVVRRRREACYIYVTKIWSKSFRGDRIFALYRILFTIKIRIENVKPMKARVLSCGVDSVSVLEDDGKKQFRELLKTRRNARRLTIVLQVSTAILSYYYWIFRYAVSESQ